jgi:hypothetical protein
VEADTSGRRGTQPDVLELVVQELTGQRFHVDDRVHEDVDVAASEMTIGNLRTRRLAERSVIRERGTG